MADDLAIARAHRVCSGDAAPPAETAGARHDAYLSKPLELRTLSDTLEALGLRPA